MGIYFIANQKFSIMPKLKTIGTAMAITVATIVLLKVTGLDEQLDKVAGKKNG